MNHHSADYEYASADLVEYYGQPILYHDPSLAGAIEFEAVVRPERTERRKNDHGWSKVQTRDLYFDADVAIVKLNGTFTIDGVVYSVEEPGTAVGNRTMVKVKRTTVGEVARPTARR